MPWEHPKLANLTLSQHHYNYQPPVPCWHDQISITWPDLSNCSASASKSAPRRNHSSRPRSLLPNGLKVYSQRWTSDRSLSLKLVPPWWSIILDYTNIKPLGDDDNASLNQFFFPVQWLLVVWTWDLVFLWTILVSKSSTSYLWRHARHECCHSSSTVPTQRATTWVPTLFCPRFSWQRTQETAIPNWQCHKAQGECPILTQLFGKARLCLWKLVVWFLCYL